MTDPTPDPTASLRTMVADALEHLAGLLRDDTGTLKTVVSTWVDDRLKAAITELLAQLTANESTLMLPLTAWANGWIQEIQAALPGIIKEGLKGFKIFMPEPTEENPEEEK